MAVYDITTAAASLEFDTQDNAYNACVAIDENHVLNFWAGPGNDGFVQVFTVNTTTWAVTTAAAGLEFDTQNGTFNACLKIDETHFINIWTGPSSKGYAQIFTVNTTTWAVTTAAASFEYEQNEHTGYNSCVLVDENHVLNFWKGVDGDGFAQILEINTTTWAVTTAAATLEFDTRTNLHNSCKKIDTNHFINYWQGGSGNNGYTQVFTVNTTTWAVTTAAASLNFEVTGNAGSHNSCLKIDTNHFVNSWRGASGDGFVQSFTVNTTTWAVTTAASTLEFDTQQNSDNAMVNIDANNFINFWAGSGTDGFAQPFSVNTTTWVITTTSSSLEFDTQSNAHNRCLQIDSSHYINFWQGTSSTDGFVQTFELELPLPPKTFGFIF